MSECQSIHHNHLNEKKNIKQINGVYVVNVIFVLIVIH